MNLWSPTNAVDLDAGVDGHPVWVAWAAHVAFWPIGVAAVVGAVVLRRRRTLLFPLLAPLMVVFTTAVFIYATPRFRVAAEGALCVLAAVAVDVLWHRIRGPAPGPDPDGSRGTHPSAVPARTTQDPESPVVAAPADGGP